MIYNCVFVPKGRAEQHADTLTFEQAVAFIHRFRDVHGRIEVRLSRAMPGARDRPPVYQSRTEWNHSRRQVYITRIETPFTALRR
jgi:hypothetical protein